MEGVMPVSARWTDESQTIMLWEFEGKWTWDDYYLIRNETNAQISALDYDVDLIIDMRNSTALPQGVFTHGRNAFSASPKNIGQTVFVGLNPVLRSFYAMFNKLYTVLLSEKDFDTMLVATLEE